MNSRIHTHRVQALLMGFWLKLSVALIAVVSFSTIHAHEINPAVVDAELVSENSLEWTIRLNLEASLAGISSEHDDTDDSPNAKEYDGLRALSASELETMFQQRSTPWLNNFIFKGDSQEPLTHEFVNIEVQNADSDTIARDTLIQVNTTLPTNSAAWSMSWTDSYGPMVVRYTDPANESQNAAHYVNPGDESPTINVRKPQEKRSILKVFTDFIGLGFIHIIPKGLDHIVFVLGLVLLHPRFKPVLAQVTLFTLAHSITLALAAFGTIALSSKWVEASIALSIVFIGLDNLKYKPMGYLRMFVVFLFGLLHGLGFASVLGELNSGTGYPVASLSGFNVGVELGQLVVVGLFFLLIGFWTRNRPWFAKVVRIPFSLALAAIGALWFYQRTIG